MHISNHSMQVGDRGVVVVGASAELGDLGHLGSAGRVLRCPESPLLANFEASLGTHCHAFAMTGDSGEWYLLFCTSACPCGQ